MKFRRRLVVIALAGVLAAPALAQQVPVVEKTLGNGMKLLMVRRAGEPSVAGGWVARVGSANERPGITGISHFFEHMMFKGTPALGTKDAAKDKEIIAQQEKVADEIRKEEVGMRAAYLRGEIGDPMKRENWTPRRTELDAEMDKLIAAQRAILVKNEFDRIYTNGGASGMNAFTNYDMTGYFITVPSNKLELWMWMESDRLLRPVFREFYAERDVVFEERRLRTESTPLGKFEEQLESMFWEASTYGRSWDGPPTWSPTRSRRQTTTTRPTTSRPTSR
jgi:predicted Zn-dependent peptidase